MNLDNLSEYKKVIRICGQEVEVNTTAGVASTLRDKLSSLGVDSFAIIINGEEITNVADIPATFEDVETLEVVRQVKAGVRRE